MICIFEIIRLISVLFCLLSIMIIPNFLKKIFLLQYPPKMKRKQEALVLRTFMIHCKGKKLELVFEQLIPQRKSFPLFFILEDPSSTFTYSVSSIKCMCTEV